MAKDNNTTIPPKAPLSLVRLARLEKIASRDRIIARNLAALRRALGLEG